jgi:hypothetical protein
MIWNVCLDTTTIVIENLYNKVTVAELSSGEGCEGCEDSGRMQSFEQVFEKKRHIENIVMILWSIDLRIRPYD